jgi:hypothetical protein
MKAVQCEQSSMRSDRQTDTAKLTVAFRNYAKTPKTSDDSQRHSRLSESYVLRLFLIITAINIVRIKTCCC